MLDNKELQFTGKTVEDAVAAACQELKIDSLDGVDFEIVQMPKKSLFKKATPAILKVTLPQSKTQAAQEYLQSILKALQLEKITFTVEEQEENAVITLAGEGLNVIIGRHGETLDALQYLCSLVASRANGSYFRVTLDSGDFRKRREKTLQALAVKMANNALRHGRKVTLEPMNPYERRIIHSEVQKIEGVSSTSIGEEPNRRVVILLDHPSENTGAGDIVDANRKSGRPPRNGNGNYRGRSDRGERRTGGRRDGRRDRGERRPSQTIDPKTVPERQVAPSEAKDLPLYGKINIDD